MYICAIFPDSLSFKNKFYVWIFFSSTSSFVFVVAGTIRRLYCLNRRKFCKRSCFFSALFSFSHKWFVRFVYLFLFRFVVEVNLFLTFSPALHNSITTLFYLRLELLTNYLCNEVLFSARENFLRFSLIFLLKWSLNVNWIIEKRWKINFFMKFSGDKVK